MRILFILMLLTPGSAMAQHTGFSYKLMNETGTFNLVSLTYSHKTDNTEGVTYVTDARTSDTLYRMNQFLNGFVALSRDGRTIAHLVSEKQGKPLDKSILTLFRDGKQYDSVPLHRLIKYQLDRAVRNGDLPESGWLLNDSLLNCMAAHPFFISDDKLFLSFEGPLLMVFDMNQMFHIYTGNGANHFHQNYYSIPNAPYRTEYDSAIFSPEGMPTSSDNEGLGHLVAKTFEGTLDNSGPARWKVHLVFKLLRSGHAEARESQVIDLALKSDDPELSEKLRAVINRTVFSTDLLPPDHPAWIFDRTFLIY